MWKVGGNTKVTALGEPLWDWCGVCSLLYFVFFLLHSVAYFTENREHGKYKAYTWKPGERVMKGVMETSLEVVLVVNWGLSLLRHNPFRMRYTRRHLPKMLFFFVMLVLVITANLVDRVIETRQEQIFLDFICLALGYIITYITITQ